MTPAETRATLELFGHEDVIAFQTRNPLHRVHEELTKRATEENYTMGEFESLSHSKREFRIMTVLLVLFVLSLSSSATRL